MSKFKNKDKKIGNIDTSTGIEDYPLLEKLKLIDRSEYLKIVENRKYLTKYDICIPIPAKSHKDKIIYLVYQDVNIIIEKEKLLISKEKYKFFLRKDKIEENKKWLLGRIKFALEDLGGAGALNYIAHKLANKDKEGLIKLYQLNNKDIEKLDNEYSKLNKTITNIGTGKITTVLRNTEDNRRIAFKIINEIIVPAIDNILNSGK